MMKYVKQRKYFAGAALIIGLSLSVSAHAQTPGSIPGCPAYPPGNLVVNSSFECDGINSSILNYYPPFQISGWSTNNTTYGKVGVTSWYDPALDGHSGYLAFCNVAPTGSTPTSGSATASQTLITTPGQTYFFSFSFSTDNLLPGPYGSGNHFRAQFGNQVVMDATNMVPRLPGWSNFDGTAVFSYFVTATGYQTKIKFSADFIGSRECMGLDDVQVLAVQ